MRTLLFLPFQNETQETRAQVFNVKIFVTCHTDEMYFRGKSFPIYDTSVTNALEPPECATRNDAYRTYS